MKNFTDFLIEAAQNPELGSECILKLNELDQNGLFSWLQKKGYNVDKNDCSNLYENKEGMKKSQTVGLTY